MVGDAIIWPMVSLFGILYLSAIISLCMAAVSVGAEIELVKKKIKYYSIAMLLIIIIIGMLVCTNIFFLITNITCLRCHFSRDFIVVSSWILLVIGILLYIPAYKGKHEAEKQLKELQQPIILPPNLT